MVIGSLFFLYSVTQTRDDQDRRRQFVEITIEGQKIIDEHTPHAVQNVSDFKIKLGEENYETLLDLLAMLDPGAID